MLNECLGFYLSSYIVTTASAEFLNHSKCNCIDLDQMNL